MRRHAVYQRLKERFKGAGRDLVEKRLLPKEMTFGEIVDASALYSVAVCSLDTPQEVLDRIAKSQLPTDIQEQARQLIAVVFQGGAVDTTSAEYNHPVDISLLTDAEQDDINHYPGGLMLIEHTGLNVPKGSYTFLLTNRQQSDNGELYLANLYTEVGLPVESNI